MRHEISRESYDEHEWYRLENINRIGNVTKPAQWCNVEDRRQPPRSADRSEQKR